MRVVFAGTPSFAATALEAILAAGHDAPLVLTQPDRPAGRGLRLVESAVSAAASRHGIETFKAASLRNAEALEKLRGVRADAMVVAAYGLILPAAVLAVPAHGCINIHASLLPRWRGAAPVQRALLAGDEMTGISIMRMDEGLDTGPVLLTRELPIKARDTGGSLTQALAGLGASAIVEALARLDALSPVPQDGSRATYAAKIAKPEALIDWSRASRDLERQVRAFNPTPGAATRFAGQGLKVWEAEVSALRGKPGEVLRADTELVVACGEGALALRQVQRQGGTPMAAAQFLRGNRVVPGAALDAVVAG